jgi:hypothetical protein
MWMTTLALVKWGENKSVTQDVSTFIHSKHPLDFMVERNGPGVLLPEFVRKGWHHVILFTREMSPEEFKGIPKETLDQFPAAYRA